MDDTDLAAIADQFAEEMLENPNENKKERVIRKAATLKNHLRRRRMRTLRRLLKKMETIQTKKRRMLKVR